MNKKGFTLAELLLVLAIIALLLLILVPNIFVMVNKNNEKSCNNLVKNIESATKIYVTNNKYNLDIKCYDSNNEEDTTTKITLQTLINSGDLTPDSTGKILNPVTDKEIPLETEVKIIYNCDTKEFTYKVDGISCEKKNNKDDETNTPEEDDETNTPDNGNEKPENSERIAQAFYSETDNSLTFVKTTKLNIGDTYNEKVVTAVYTGFENDVYSEYASVPWYEKGNDIISVIIEDTITPKSTAFWFDGFINCEEFTLEKLDTSNVTNMSFMFVNCVIIKTLNLNNWDTSKVENMNSLFGNCSSLTELYVSDWDTSNVTNMQLVFSGCTSLTKLDLSNWDTSNVTNMYSLFSFCSSLTKLDLSKWDTSNVTNMGWFFNDCSSLTELYVSNWDTSNVTNMYAMFSECSSLTKLDLSNWDTSNVTNMYALFSECSMLEELTLGLKWDTSNVTNMGWFFSGCSRLTIDCSEWIVDKVTGYGQFKNNAPNVIEPIWKKI